MKNTETSWTKKNKTGYENESAFQKFLIHYLSLPTHKKVLSSMIHYSEMYQPITSFGKYYDFLGFNHEENEYRRLKRAEIYLCARELIKTSDPHHGPKIIITSRGRRVFFKEYPLAVLRTKKWDGFWTIIMYDFPEKLRIARNLFRRKITSLGFGSPQISILASPLGIEEEIQRYIKGEKFSDYVWVLRAKRILGLDNIEVARRTWAIEEINQLYQELLQKLPVIKQLKSENETRRWKLYFLAVNHSDPFLPYELLPENWAGDRCVKEFIKLGRFGFLRALLNDLVG